jgi:hypothetical protein
VIEDIPIKMGLVQWLMAVIPPTQEAEIRRIMVQGQLMQKFSKPSISTNKLDMLVHTCNPIYIGDIGRRIVDQG